MGLVPCRGKRGLGGKEDQREGGRGGPKRGGKGPEGEGGRGFGGPKGGKGENFFLFFF